MAASFVARSARVSMTLAAGTDPVSGKAITKTLGFGSVATNADATALSNVVDLIAPVLVHPVSRSSYTVVKDIEKE